MNTADTIYIIGRGAIGKALAVFLKTNNRNVVLIRGSVSEGSPHIEDIGVTLNDGATLNAQIDVNNLSNLKELRGIVVLTSKSFGNADLATALKEKTSGSPLVILQNGLGVEQPFLNQNFTSIYRCVLFVTSQNLDQSSVRFKPVSACPIGIVKGNTDELKQITTTLHTEHFQFRTELNIDVVIWKKAIINCAFNSICPLLETDNGIFHRDKEALAIARRIVDECVHVAASRGISISADEVIENLLLISKSSEGQAISTLQDIRNRQPTEIDTLNFEVSRIAESMGIGHRVQETRLLGELIRMKSKLTIATARSY